ncbi:hypothetical protein QR685DRAFT_571674 [Neurospora intermedia]|uniref:Uncharacterized protein n=1 Tax=Neurospora intermedia TaxID=5142 RepID=A0ABR3DD20_NEUIN
MLMVDGGKGRNEEKGKLIEWVGKKGGRELKDEERDGMLACLWMGGEEKKGKGSIQFFARHGEGSFCFSGPVGGASNGRDHGQKPRLSKKGTGPASSKPLGMTGWAGNSAQNRNFQDVVVWVFEGSEVPVLCGVSLWILVGQLLEANPG